MTDADREDYFDRVMIIKKVHHYICFVELQPHPGRYYESLHLRPWDSKKDGIYFLTQSKSMHASAFPLGTLMKVRFNTCQFKVIEPELFPDVDYGDDS